MMKNLKFLSLALMPLLLLSPAAAAAGSGTSPESPAYQVLAAWYNHSPGTFTAGSVQFNFTHAGGRTDLSLTPVGATTAQTVFLITQVPQGYLLVNGQSGQKVLVTQDGAQVDPTVSYGVYVLYGGADPDPTTGYHSECTNQWMSQVYTAGSGQLELTWHSPDWAGFTWIYFFIGCAYAYFDGGSISITGNNGFSNINTGLPHDNGYMYFNIPYASWTGSLAVAVSWDYQIISPP
jgi:hypothetical protein